jgi:transcriptional regulator with XRE-family HTH domain
MSDETAANKVFGEAFRHRLIEVREAAGVTPGQLATRIGTSAAQVSRWESGVYVPRLYWIVMIAKALGCELSALAPEVELPAETEDQPGDTQHDLGGEG